MKRLGSIAMIFVLLGCSSVGISKRASITLKTDIVLTNGRECSFAITLPTKISRDAPSTHERRVDMRVAEPGQEDWKTITSWLIDFRKSRFYVPEGSFSVFASISVSPIKLNPSRPGDLDEAKYQREISAENLHRARNPNMRIYSTAERTKSITDVLVNGHLWHKLDYGRPSEFEFATRLDDKHYLEVSLDRTPGMNSEYTQQAISMMNSVRDSLRISCN